MMRQTRRPRGTGIAAAAMLLAGGAGAGSAYAQTHGSIDVDQPAGGDSYVRATDGDGARPIAAANWTLSAWIAPRDHAAGTVLVAGFGDPVAGPRRYLALIDGRPALVTEAGRVAARAALPATGWHRIAATLEGGRARLYIDGRAVASTPLAVAPVSATATVGPRGVGPAFAGRIAGFRLDGGAASAAALAAAAKAPPDPALIAFQTGSPTWPVQVRQMYGQTAPQDAWTLPRSRAPLGTPVAKPEPTGPAIVAAGPGEWMVNGWRLAESPTVAAAGEAISRTGFDARRWYAATVPGTVLTTLVDRGVYPDPSYGLSNTAIPERLARQDYWYRTEFEVPAGATGRHRELLFKGVNYAAEVWVNGQKLGTMTGAFIRGHFDVTNALVAGRNAVAVRVSPPPHPGLNQEESLTSGVGENGGMMMLDGPTFVATEGWDWIPTIRDRNTGLWQGVALRATGDATIGDAHVVTALPRPDNSIADVEITVPVANRADHAVTASVRAAFDDVRVEKQVTLAPGQHTDVVLRPAEFPQLSVRNPRLWWPNGYGEAALHDLTLTTSVGAQASDNKRLRFGMRQVTYDLSLMDKAGDLKRVTVNLTRARAGGTTAIVDASHTGIRKVPNGWAMTLVPGAESNSAVTPLADAPGLSPYMSLRVNGVRIAAKGGNIGMDDFMKRVSRDRLEPMFRLHRDAHLNIVRNWVGQDTEETFFELADQYGIMVLSDFWESTQDYNIETEVPATFMANAADVVKRFRNHPSIVVWFGRNEGVPQPALNEDLERLIRDEDGTPSLPTLEAWMRTMAPADRWPISDTWAYHDWHQTGNGAVKTYMDALDARFGAGTSLPDFERKAQMMQYESYRAIFEGFNAGLWTINSGRMLWMTQPAWPSSAWNIFSSDYDTHASFYGVKKASEPVHVQMNLPDGRVVLVNNTLADLVGVTVKAHAVGLAGATLTDRSADVAATHEKVTDAFALDLPALTANGMALIRLTATGADGRELSSNFYWQGKDDAAYRGLTALAPAPLQATATRGTADDETEMTVTLANRGQVPAIEAKLTVMNADGSQVLPAYFSDNYVSLLPGETRTVTIRYPAAVARGERVALRGWNVAAASIAPR